MSEERILNLLNNKKYFEAKKLISNLMRIEKKNSKYNFYYGLILANEKKFKDAISFFMAFRETKKDDYDSNFNIAGCYLGLLNFKKAIEFYENCLKLNLKRHEPFHQLGICYRLIREYEKSIYYLNKAIEIKENPFSYNLLGKVYRENGKFVESKYSFENSISFDDNFLDSKLSLANLENDCGNYQRAIEILNNVTSSNKSNHQILTRSKIIMGNVLRSKGDYNGAIELNKNALEMDSTNIDASYNLSLCYLFIKDYEKAWKFHEARYNLQSFVLLKKMHDTFRKPRWDNNKPKKNILFYGEQGIGEQILYSQFYDAVQDQFKNITIAVNQKLIPFFKKIYNNVEIIDYRLINNYDNYEYHLPMGSMGLYFQKNLNFHNYKNIDYLSYKNIAPKKNKRLRCGISWKSTNKIFGNKKSMKLEHFKNLFLTDEIEFINLQYTNEEKEIESLEEKINKSIFLDHKIDCFNDINGVASLIKSCDFVITVSNSNAHISGKLGVKTFLLLPFSDGKLWYWGLNTDNEIIWYPSIKPLRMEKENDWNSCIINLEKELENFL